MNLDDILKKLDKSISLSFEESKFMFDELTSGQVSDDVIEKILIKLSSKGESIEEISGGVISLRKKSRSVDYDGDLLDTCGTGGDGKNTINISSAVALILSAYGIKIAKHGNKNISSNCGSANLFEEMGININLNPHQIKKSLNNNNFAFMCAPNYHPAMKYVANARKKIKQRTIFNLLGPLLNPCQVNRQIIGVFSSDILEKYIHVLKKIKLKKAWVFHSNDGLDEISLFDKTQVYEIENEKINRFEINPNEIVSTNGKLSDILGADAKYNKEKIIEVLKGKTNTLSQIITLNCAAGLIVSSKDKDLKNSYVMIEKFLQTGKAFNHLEKVIKND